MMRYLHSCLLLRCGYIVFLFVWFDLMDVYVCFKGHCLKFVFVYFKPLCFLTAFTIINELEKNVEFFPIGITQQWRRDLSR